MKYWQVDVFAEQPLEGNGLAVFLGNKGYSERLMQALTREYRQFESIFLTSTPNSQEFLARIFTSEGELPFAGHPLLGAASLLHYLREDLSVQATWTFLLSNRHVEITTSKVASAFYANMNQGHAIFGEKIGFIKSLWLAESFSSELDIRYSPQVVSTGLPYLLLPVTSSGLASARQIRSVSSLLSSVGADFVYLMDVDSLEGRTWDAYGVVEDAATGSAAGPVAAWRVSQGLNTKGEPFSLNQGRFLERPSILDVEIDQNSNVFVGGNVHIISGGKILLNADRLSTV